MRVDLSIFVRVVLLCNVASLLALAQDDSPLTRLYDTRTTSATPLAPQVLLKPSDWTLVPEDKVDHPFQGDTVLVNDKLAVVLRKSRPGAEVYAKTTTGWKFRTALDGVAATPSSVATTGVRILENTSGGVLVKTLTATKGASMAFRLTAGEAILEIRPDEAAAFLNTRLAARHLIIPDYFGDDMVFPLDNPRPRCLPAENFCLHLLEGGDGIVMTVWLASEVWLDPSTPAAGANRTTTRLACRPGKTVWLDPGEQ